ncbi:1,4-dihydroxy-2-naphthoate prenyltransferase [Motilibacter rhizosphaerae]|uniref:1,4-dihydroxy-2-naphthoate octaprenyltransferase n=1 Tax=Motilibacter rhizosphaerae TaxID=598652 RepID=A0A4Q7NAC2_9ACTN|nr:1,4-dihydroxy-2-naphthoate polyprenyltransferase [Motilibacter rhizosphaerae]RZS79039.1 1,4-dihydroxy-2-naphthoate prenyltransferase [Motilibacter rhizosphaerae]
MTTTAQWVSGARPRTLPAAIAPVLAGTGAAVAEGGAVAWRAVVAAVVALALQVGVNYANDYSDGIRGTDDERVGPFRLVGSRAASPGAVRAAAFAAFGVACVAGLVLVVATGAWWLLAVGAVSVAAAWGYTGTSHPYGYAGLGELAVFVFFGLVAVTGTAYVQTESLPWLAVGAAVGVGALACTLLVANNLRDIPSDAVSGKRTLAVRLGDARTRLLYAGLLALAALVPLALAPARPGALLALLALPLAAAPVRVVRSGARGRDLIPVLAGTGRLQLAYGALLGLGLAL